MEIIKNYLKYSLWFVLIVFAVLLGLHWLPALTIDGHTMRRVDLLSDLRYPESETAAADSDSIPLPPVVKPAFVDTCRTGMTCIEDYSDSTLRGMTPFYKALDRVSSDDSDDKQVRIAVFGDSFIEADIFTADLREMLQKQFGGCGVGFVTITSMTSGFLWYQGESNISNYQFYAPMMTAMVQLWRNVWEAPDMPFYYVQIAPYKYENSSNTGAALLREAQMEALKTIPNSGMVPTTDIGDEFCIHPPQKDVVGLRLATLALTKTYGIRRLPSNGPTMTKVDYADKKAIVTFDNAPAGLFPTFSELEGFEIAGADKKFYPAKAKIVGRTNTVEVWSEEVAQPIAVRYAFRNYVGNITLRNTFGLSAFPFRTDTWDDVK